MSICKGWSPEKGKGPVTNTGPVEAGQGGRSGGRKVGCVPANPRVRTQGANPEKMFDARDLPRLCPPHTHQARVEPRPGVSLD